LPGGGPAPRRPVEDGGGSPVFRQCVIVRSRALRHSTRRSRAAAPLPFLLRRRPAPFPEKFLTRPPTHGTLPESPHPLDSAVLEFQFERSRRIVRDDVLRQQGRSHSWRRRPEQRKPEAEPTG